MPRGADRAACWIVPWTPTSTSRHAGPSHADVLVRYHTHALELEILDDGCGPGPGPPARAGEQSGHGLVGMRERVTLYGGTLHAGPRAAPARTGYAVRVRLPTNPDGT
jgi:signal transduction histidine kinase